MAASLPIKQIGRGGLRRIEQSHDDPSRGCLMLVADEEMSVVLIGHFIFEFVAECPLPIVAILPTPVPIGLSHLPIEARQAMAWARCLCATKVIFEIEWNLLQLSGWHSWNIGICRSVFSCSDVQAACSESSITKRVICAGLNIPSVGNWWTSHHHHGNEAD